MMIMKVIFTTRVRKIQDQENDKLKKDTLEMQSSELFWLNFFFKYWYHFNMNRCETTSMQGYKCTIIKVQ